MRSIIVILEKEEEKKEVEEVLKGNYEIRESFVWNDLLSSFLSHSPQLSSFLHSCSLEFSIVRNSEESRRYENIFHSKSEILLIFFFLSSSLFVFILSLFL